jgi:hypothetical protein
MAREKTAVIVFPPLTMPTSPPLGASFLKGFVERELPEWRVKVLDLNLWTFERLFAELAAGRLQLDPQVFPEGFAAANGLIRAAEVFRGKNDDEFYSRPDLYNQYGELFLRFTEAYTRALGQLCESHHKGAPISQVVQDFLNLIMVDKPLVVGISMIFSEQLPVGALLGKAPAAELWCEGGFRRQLLRGQRRAFPPMVLGIGGCRDRRRRRRSSPTIPQ